MQYQLDIIGYDAILIRFTGADNTQLLPIIYALNLRLKKAADLSAVIIDIIPSYQTLLVTFNILNIDACQIAKIIDAHVKQQLKQSAQNVMSPPLSPLSTEYKHTHSMASRLLNIPVCYHESLAPDLESLSQHAAMSIDDIIQIHSSTIYSCYAIGFMPNFAYLGDVDKRIQIPRHSSPRAQVPAGSVGIADNQTAIYPKTSPGGWQIIGQSPALLDTLSVGCQVKFQPISLDDFNDYNLEANA